MVKRHARSVELNFHSVKKKTKNDWLQAARALAAVAVMLFHLSPHLALVQEFKPIEQLLPWGFAGVDIFFVLSGFVVYKSADNAAFRWNTFLLRRIARIFLGYWPVLVFLAGVTLVTGNWPTQTLFWKSVFLLSPSLFVNWLSTAWSLTYELYFYLWITLLCVLTVRARGRLIVILIAVLVAWNLGWHFLAFDGESPGALPLRFAFTGFGIEFFAGALLAHWRQRDPWPQTSSGRLWLLFVGALFMVCGLIIGGSSPIYPIVDGIRALTFGVAGLGCILIALALADLQFSVWPPVVLVGDASYSLYLLHAPLLILMGLIREIWELSGPSLVIYSITVPLLIVWFSIYWFRWIEQPLFRWAMASRLFQFISKPKGHPPPGVI